MLRGFNRIQFYIVYIAAGRQIGAGALIVLCAIMALTGAVACKKSGPTIIECGGPAQFACPPGMYCDYGETCGGLDKVGTCRRQFTDCPNEDLPVCGCNGEDYASPCYANASGVTIAYKGTCIRDQKVEAPPPTKFEFPELGEIRTGDIENAGDVERIEEDY